MTLLFYFIAFLMYCILAYVPYTKFVNSKYYYFISLLGIITNICWLGIAKLAENQKNILIRGLLYDIMITVVYLLVPIVLFNIELTRNNVVGISLIFIGLVVLKL